VARTVVLERAAPSPPEYRFREIRDVDESDAELLVLTPSEIAAAVERLRAGERGGDQPWRRT
jgi:hypothetical protein